MQRRIPAAICGLLLAALFFPCALPAQGGAFRTSFGGTVLAEIEEPAPAPGRIPGFRASLERQLTPRFGLHLTALHLAPTDVSVWGGLAGARFNLTTGRVRLGLFAEAGYAAFTAAQDSGGFWTTGDGGLPVYRPFRRKVTGTGFGGGGGLITELILGPGFTLRFTGGYWMFVHDKGELGLAQPGSDEPRFPANQIASPFLGAGLRWAVRDMTWYWRTSGADTRGPVIARTDPTRDGVIQLGWDSARVYLHDGARVERVTVAGSPLEVRRTRAENATEEVVLRGWELRLPPGVHEVELEAEDGAGNTATHTLRVQGPPPDEAGPEIRVASPAAGEQLTSGLVAVRGVVLDETPPAEVLVEGVPAEVTPVAEDPVQHGGARHHRVYRFEASLRVATGEIPLAVVATDTLGNQSRAARVVARPDLQEPEIRVASPTPNATIPAGLTTFTGTVIDDGVITRVQVAGVEAAVEPVVDPEEAAQVGPDRRMYRFRVDVPLRDGTGPVEIAASDAAGKRASVVMPLTRTAVAAAGAAATALPIVRIEEPAEWARAGNRGITAAARQSIRVRGTVLDPGGAGIMEVRIDGERAAVSPGPGGTVRFTGFVPVDTDTRDVEIAAVTNDGRQTAEVYPIQARGIAATDVSGAQRMASALDGQRFAVVIGISDYADPAIPDLRYADDDARAFYEFLRSDAAGLGGIPEQNIRLLIDDEATDREIRSALLTFLQQATERDVVIIYMAAHGAPNPDRLSDLYVLAHNTEADDIPATAISMNHVNEAVNKVKSLHTVLITDACHSGGIGSQGFGTRALGGADLNGINQVFLQELQATTGGLAVFTASESRELSREGEEWGGGHGVFTYHLLQGLYGEADQDGNRVVTLGEAIEYTRISVQRDTRNGQNPSIASQNHDRWLPLSIVVGSPPEGM